MADYTGKGQLLTELSATSSVSSDDYFAISNANGVISKMSYGSLKDTIFTSLATQHGRNAVDTLLDSDFFYVASTDYNYKSISYLNFKNLINKMIQDKIDKLPIIKVGRASVTIAEANKPSSTEITFPSGLFTSTPRIAATPVTGVPGTGVLGVGINNVSKTGFTLYVTRTNTTTTAVNWIAVES